MKPKKMIRLASAKISGNLGSSKKSDISYNHRKIYKHFEPYKNITDENINSRNKNEEIYLFNSVLNPG
jgi:hypothetical protein